MELSSIFSGIGTEIIDVIISLVVGTAIGYKVGIRSGKNQQIQNAGNNSKQTQIGKISYGNKSSKDGSKCRK